jgi:hypothetical protein
MDVEKNIQHTIQCIIKKREDLCMETKHSCRFDTCNPQSVHPHYTMDEIQHLKLVTYVYVCKYQCVHICNQKCTGNYTDDGCTCFISGCKKQQYSSFERKDGIVVTNDTMNSKRSINDMNEAHTQDNKYNRHAVYRHSIISTKKKPARFKRKRVKQGTTRTKKASNVDTYSMDEWIDIFRGHKKLGKCVFHFSFAESFVQNLTREQMMISTGELNAYDYLKQIPCMNPIHLDVVKEAENIMRKILPGIHRLRIEQKHIQAQQNKQYGKLSAYMQDCMRLRVLPEASRMITILQFDHEEYSQVLHLWPTWNQWICYLRYILHWWCQCERADAKTQSRWKCIDPKQHTLAVLYKMRETYVYKDTIDDQYPDVYQEHTLIPQDSFIKCQDYLVRLNRLTKYDFERQSNNIGCRILTDCIGNLLLTYPIHEITPMGIIMDQ